MLQGVQNRGPMGSRTPPPDQAHVVTGLGPGPAGSEQVRCSDHGFAAVMFRFPPQTKPKKEGSLFFAEHVRGPLVRT